MNNLPKTIFLGIYTENKISFEVQYNFIKDFSQVLSTSYANLNGVQFSIFAEKDEKIVYKSKLKDHEFSSDIPYNIDLINYGGVKPTNIELEYGEPFLIDIVSYAKRIFSELRALEVSFSEQVFSGTIPLDIQNEFVQLGKKYFEQVKGITGYIVKDHLAPTAWESPFERSIYLNDWEKKPEIYQNTIRGIYWSNFVNKELVEKYSKEFEELKDICKVEDLNGDTYFQLNEDINSDISEKQEKIYKLLEDIIPKRDF